MINSSQCVVLSRNEWSFTKSDKSICDLILIILIHPNGERGDLIPFTTHRLATRLQVFIEDIRLSAPEFLNR